MASVRLLLAATAALLLLLPHAAMATPYIVPGGGSTFVAPVYQQWAASYIFVDPTAQFTFSAVGSSAGGAGLMSGIYDWAGTDSASLVASVPGGDGMLIPLLCGGVVPVYNVPFNGTGPLTLNGQVLADIFMGTITTWDDPAIAALNPTLSLPSIPVVLVVRSDGSGTSSIFTAALEAFSSTWPAAATGTKPTWPAAVTKHYENAGVAVGVRENVGGIGYVGVSYAAQFGVPYAQMVNAAGNTVNATSDAILSAMKDFELSFDGNFSATVVNGPGANSWPITGYTYILLKRSTLADCTAALYIAQFLQWASSDANAEQLSAQLGFVSAVGVDDTLAEQVWGAINQMQCNSIPVTRVLRPNQIAYIAIAGVLCVVQLLLMAYAVYSRNESWMRASNWKAQILSQTANMILLCSIFVWDTVANNAACHLQVWMTAVGSSLLIGRAWAKSARPWKYFKGYGILTPVTDSLIITCTLALAAVDVIVCIIWSSAGQLRATGLNECTSISFWGYFGFLLAYKAIIICWTIIAALNTPPSLSYFGETLYFVQTSSAIVVLCALHLPVIFLVAPTPHNIVRQIFEPSVLIMSVVIAVTSIIVMHRIELRRVIQRARKALMNRNSSSRTSGDRSLTSGGGGGGGGSGTETSASEKDDPQVTATEDSPNLLGGVAGTVVVESMHSKDATAIEMTVADDTPRKHKHDASKSHANLSANNQNNKRLEKLLANVSTRLRFRQLLNQLRCCEILDFWMATRDYKTLQRPSQRVELARTIHAVFLSRDADEQINLTSQVYSELIRYLAPVLKEGSLMSEVETGKTNDSQVLPDDLFKASSDQVFEMMRGIYVEHFTTFE